jgi:ribosomal protein S18 acetylase RimI-like enzyme
VFAHAPRARAEFSALSREIARMQIRPYEDVDFEDLVALWERCGLLRPWNDPTSDIALCGRTPTSALFVGFAPGEGAALMASVMTGSDGHRGWLYYLAVDPLHRQAGRGRRLVRHAEAWLAGQGIGKVQLMIRAENEPVRDFYAAMGYEVEERIVMSRRLARA